MKPREWAIDEATGEQGYWQKEKVKVDSKELEEYSLVKNKHRTLHGGQKKMVLGGPREIETRKVFSKGQNCLSGSGFRTYQPERSSTASD